MPRSPRSRWFLPIDRPPVEDGWIETGRRPNLRVGGGDRRQRPRVISATSRSFLVSSTPTLIWN